MLDKFGSAGAPHLPTLQDESWWLAKLKDVQDVQRIRGTYYWPEQIC